VARAVWGDGSFYVMRAFVLERFEVDTGALSTLEVDLPGTQLLYDRWSQSVVSIDYASIEVVPVP
jgi:N-methylhydantoinase B/oxoprolinase/acetone carboxylase alpha subunit